MVQVLRIILIILRRRLSDILDPSRLLMSLLTLLQTLRGTKENIKPFIGSER